MAFPIFIVFDFENFEEDAGSIGDLQKFLTSAVYGTIDMDLGSLSEAVRSGSDFSFESLFDAFEDRIERFVDFLASLAPTVFGLGGFIGIELPMFSIGNTECLFLRIAWFFSDDLYGELLPNRAFLKVGELLFFSSF